jgi:cytochrome c oxidase subunit III
VIFLILTLFFGGVFLGVKAFEWKEKFEEHHIPGQAGFHLEGTTQQGHAQLFFSLYFAMTGLHALHMVIGIGILLTLILQARKGRFSAEYYTPVDVAGLYWHFVDVIWIFLFPAALTVGHVQQRHGRWCIVDFFRTVPGIARRTAM